MCIREGEGRGEFSRLLVGGELLSRRLHGALEAVHWGRLRLLDGGVVKAKRTRDGPGELERCLPLLSGRIAARRGAALQTGHIQVQ
jgi:hypothetical protein